MDGSRSESWLFAARTGVGSHVERSSKCGVGTRKSAQSLTEYDQINEEFETIDYEDMDAMDKLLERQAAVQDAIDAADAWELDRRVDIAMDALRVPDGDASIEHLSGGEKRRVALCALLLSKPELLLLDEPTNHLDAESVAWLERHLDEYAGTVVFVTHDRYFLDNVAKWILEIDNGRGVPWEGNYSSWLEQKQKKLHKQNKARGKQRTLAKELEWIQMGTKKRSLRNKARVKQYENLLMDIEAGKIAERKLDIAIPNGPRLGETVVRARGLCKGFGDRWLIRDLDFDLPRGGIVGIVGANGAGKTTLFKMISGEETPDQGELTVGQTVQLSYVSQGRDELEADKSVWQNITGGHEPHSSGFTRDQLSCLRSCIWISRVQAKPKGWRHEWWGAESCASCSNAPKRWEPHFTR